VFRLVFGGDRLAVDVGNAGVVGVSEINIIAITVVAMSSEDVGVDYG
jgi:hypothetical protein